MFESEVLRSFLAVARVLSFTDAAASLGLGQPAVSQHVRRLENTIGHQLFVRDTRNVTLTADGEAMAEYARTILAVHEEALGHFNGSGLAGRLRFGVTDDLALTSVPRILRDFRQTYPRIELEITVSQSSALEKRVESGHLDVAFIKQWPTESRGRLVRRDRVVWAGLAGGQIDADRPVPLVVYHGPSPSRSRAIQALERAGRPYRVTCRARDVLGIVAAGRAGIGVATFARSLVPDDFVEVPASAGLPDLGDIDLVLFTNSRSSNPAVDALTSAILASGHTLKPSTGSPTGIRAPLKLSPPGV